MRRTPLLAFAAFAALALPGPASPAEDNPRATIPASYGDVLAVAFSPDGKTLACGCGKDLLDPLGEVLLWDVAAGKSRAVLKGHTGAVTSLAYTADGKTLASGSCDMTVRLWDVEKGEARTTLKPGWVAAPVNAVAVSRDGKLVAAGDWVLRLWAPPAAKERGVFWFLAADGTTDPHSGGVQRDTINAVAFSPDDGLLASGGWDGTVKLWDVSKAKDDIEADDAVARLRGQKKWDARAGKALYTLRGPAAQVWSVAFAPDGKTVAVAHEDGTVKLWDPATGKERATLRHGAAVKSLAFAPEGGLLASGGEDGAVKLWDPATGKERTTIKAHAGAVRSVAFAPDGRALATAGGKEAKLWDVPAAR